MSAIQPQKTYHAPRGPHRSLLGGRRDGARHLNAPPKWFFVQPHFQKGRNCVVCDRILDGRFLCIRKCGWAQVLLDFRENGVASLRNSGIRQLRFPVCARALCRPPPLCGSRLLGALPASLQGQGIRRMRRDAAGGLPREDGTL